MSKIFFEINGEEHCNEAGALAEMLAAGSLLFVAGDSGPFFQTESGDKQAATIHINCNDLWAWGCADEIPLPKDEIGSFYKAWKAEGKWETTKWCCVRENLQPQKPIRNDMKTDGAWDDVMKSLPKNPDN